MRVNPCKKYGKGTPQRSTLPFLQFPYPGLPYPFL
nr:MAG TPA: hypothetical protein [Caudoviricetes sp.]